MKDLAGVTNITGTFPDVAAQDKSSPSATDGTALQALWVNELFGAFQALLSAAGLTPDASTEAAGTSQILQSIQLVAGHPGEVFGFPSDTLPTGMRALKLEGQVISIASYSRLVSAVYCGDTLNPSAAAFYKTSDGAGLTRSTSGTYLVLPDYRGLFLRGRDTSEFYDPDGHDRTFGDVQDDTIGPHTHTGLAYGVNAYTGNSYPYGSTSSKEFITREAGGHTVTTGAATAGSGVSTESRPSNTALTWCIRY